MNLRKRLKEIECELADAITEEGIHASVNALKLIKKLKEEDIEPNKYEIFYKHIESHLKPGQKVICKICSKDLDEVLKEKKTMNIDLLKIVQDNCTHEYNWEGRNCIKCGESPFKKDCPHEYILGSIHCIHCGEGKIKKDKCDHIWAVDAQGYVHCILCDLTPYPEVD